MRCQFVQISLIWGLWDCKLSLSACLSVMNFKNFSFFSPFVQRFHIVIFYAFGLLLLQCLSTFSSANSLSNIVSCFTLFRVSCDRYNLTEELFNSLTKKCRLIEHLFLETYGYPRKAFPLWSFPFCYFQVSSSSPIVWQVR